MLYVPTLRHVIFLLIIGLLTATARGQSQAPPVERPQQAPPVGCPCTGSRDCVCPPGLCACAACDYSTAKKLAADANRPLLTVIGCPSCLSEAKKVPGAVVTFVPQGYFQGADLISLGTVVALPDGRGGFDVAREFPPGATADALREACQRVVNRPLLPPIYGQAATPPFVPGPVTTPATSAPTVAGPSTQFLGGVPTGLTPTPARSVGPRGFTRGCAT